MFFTKMFGTPTFKGLSLIFKLLLFSFICLNTPSYSDFEYEWVADGTHYGKESYTPVEPLKLKIFGQEKVLSDSSAALVLKRSYNIILDNYWTDREAHILLNAFNQINPSSVRFASDWKQSFWIKIAMHLPDDIAIIENNDSVIVVITNDAITESDTMVAEIDGIKGKLFSKRMHKAVLRYIYNLQGRHVLENILLNRFGVEVRPWAIDYEQLTKYTTTETSTRFESFKDEELIYMINILEEYPGGMLKTPGLKYIIRRKDGLTHPLHPLAPAVAWPTVGYIEFMSHAFKDSSREYIYRLVLHEKSHFLWEHLFDNQLKQDWIELGGWFEDPDDPNGWSTTDETRFVSDYAHNVNPNEDMTESISFYIVNPNKLKTNAPKKYEFIQNRIMHGTRYISKIREDLTFQVYNLYPDYTYPARIKRIYIKITGEPEEDKDIFVEIEINSTDGLDNAKTAYIRMFHDKNYMHDLAWFTSYENGKILRYNGKISKYKASGYWHCNWLRIVDESNNKRITEPPNIGWKFYLDNPLEDLSPPEYVKDSCRLEIASIEETENGNIYNVKASWKVIDDNDHLGLGIYAYLNDPGPNKWYEDGWGEYDKKSKTAAKFFTLHDYDSNGYWELSQISMFDVAGNRTDIYINELNLKVFVDTQNPDYEGVKIKTGIGDILINATPTNAEYPNGETIVDIYFYAKDNVSGLRHISTYLRDPLGRSYRYGKYFYKPEGIGEWHQYHQRILLPKGSAPGVWGLHEIVTTDYARNGSNYDFTTLVRFEVDENVMSAPGILKTSLLPNYPNPCNPETWIPYQLSSQSDVSITIYSIDGLVVRQLNLGIKSPGKYLNREKSAYWDGKNSLGESVSSGIYFYNLKVGDFTETRKMLIRK